MLFSGLQPVARACALGSVRHATTAIDSTSADRRQEESENCTGQVDVRQQADRRCVGWLCRRGDRRLLACWILPRRIVDKKSPRIALARWTSGSKQIDDALDGCVGAVIGGF